MEREEISFYYWMQDNYTMVSDGWVRRLSMDEKERVIITTTRAYELYKLENEK